MRRKSILRCFPRGVSAIVERLEVRQLLSGALTPQGNPTVCATVPGLTVPFACAAVGSNTFLAYYSGQSIFGEVLGPTANVVVPSFKISGTQTADNTPIAAITDSQGNAVVAYSAKVSGIDQIYLGRFDGTGAVVDAPSLAAASGDTQTEPALAPDTGGSIALAFTDLAPSASSSTIFAGMFGGNDVATVAPKVCPPAATGALSRDLPSIVDIANWNFQFAWREIDTSNGTSRVTIGSNTITGTGTLGSPLSALTTSAGNFGAPLLVTAPGGAANLFCTQNQISSNTYQGYTLFHVGFNADGSIASTQPGTVVSGTAPNQASLLQVAPITTGSAPFYPILLQAGTNGPSGFIVNGLGTAGADANGNAVFTPTTVATGDITGAAFVNNNSLFSSTFTSTNSSTVISDQPATPNAEQAQPTVSIGDGAYKAKGFAKGMIFPVTLDSASTNTVTVTCTVPATAANAAQTFDVTFSPGQTKINVTVEIKDKAPNGTVVTANLSDPTNATLGTATATGKVGAANLGLESGTGNEIRISPTTIAGEKINDKVSFRLTNLGGPFSGRFSETLDAVGTKGETVPLFAGTREVHLGTGGSEMLTFKIDMFPADTPADRYQILLHAIAPSVSLNAAANKVTTVAALVQIFTVLPFYTDTNKTVDKDVVRGYLLAGLLIASNAEFDDFADIVIFLTPIVNTPTNFLVRPDAGTVAHDAASSATETVVLNTKRHLRLSPGQSIKLPEQFKVPKTLPAGQYLVTATLTAGSVTASGTAASPLTIA